MKSECIYYVESYIPSDENIIHGDIKKLIRIGGRYYWTSIMYNYGIGFNSEDYKGEESERDAFIKLEGFRCGTNRLIKGSLIDAVDLMNKFEDDLKHELD
jgi:hypothetical protein